MGLTFKEYLWKEWRYNVHSKYCKDTKYFDTWYSNLTDNQILYLTAYSKGLKSPFT